MEKQVKQLIIKRNFIDINSKIYKILNKNFIKINSRHNDRLLSTNLDIVGISNDNVIEIIESSVKKFFIGVQYHPESMIDYDDIQNSIFEYFVKCCNKNQYINLLNVI